MIGLDHVGVFSAYTEVFPSSVKMSQRMTGTDSFYFMSSENFILPGDVVSSKFRLLWVREGVGLTGTEAAEVFLKRNDF